MNQEKTSWAFPALCRFALAVLCLSFFLHACTPPVTFNKPQPAGVDSLLYFPKRIQGKYLSLDDNSLLTVSRNTITRLYDYDVKLHVNQLDSLQKLSGDTLINTQTNEKLIVRVADDTIFRHVNYTDTLFTINEFNVLKRFRGFYFINTLYGKGGWEVKKIHLYQGRLMVSSISSIREIELLESITESKQDTISQSFSLTKKQFKTFVRSSGFSNSETFVKTK